MTNFAVQPLTEFSTEAAAAALTRCFEGYVVELSMDGESFARRFAAEDLSWPDSLIWTADSGPAAILLIARRGPISRVAAMGIAPDFRGRGLGGVVMDRALADARARGDASLMLEVIQSNTPAVRLYERKGFVRSRALVGAVGTPPAAPTGRVERMSPADVARAVENEADLAGSPWQLAPRVLPHAHPTAAGFSLDGRAYTVIVPGDPARLAFLYVRPGARRQGLGRMLLAAAAAELGLKQLSPPPIFPEDPFEAVFARLGWAPHPIAQFEMHANLQEH